MAVAVVMVVVVAVAVVMAVVVAVAVVMVMVVAVVLDLPVGLWSTTESKMETCTEQPPKHELRPKNTG